MVLLRNYREIAEDLHRRIAAGEYPPGAQIPSYHGLATLYEVSVSTAYRAVTLLKANGVVVGRVGLGVYVAPRSNDSGAGDPSGTAPSP